MLLQKSSFGHSYRTRNILTRFCSKSPRFGKSNRTRNIFTRFYCKSPTFGHSCRTRNISTTFRGISPTFGHSYRTRNISTKKALVLVTPTELEIFWQDFVVKPLVLVNTDVSPTCLKFIGFIKEKSNKIFFFFWLWKKNLHFFSEKSWNMNFEQRWSYYYTQYPWFLGKVE